MRDAEEVAREALGCTEVHPDCPEWFHPTGFHTPPNPCVKCDELHAIGVIRARDAEVRAEALAKVLAGFTEERTAFFEHDEGTGRLRRSATGIPYRRLVGPWEPEP